MKKFPCALLLFTLSSFGGIIEHTIVVNENVQSSFGLLEFEFPKYPGASSKLIRTTIDVDLSTQSEAQYEYEPYQSREQLYTYVNSGYAQQYASSYGTEIQELIFSHTTSLLRSTSFTAVESFTGTGKNHLGVYYSVSGGDEEMPVYASRTNFRLNGVVTVRYEEAAPNELFIRLKPQSEGSAHSSQYDSKFTSIVRSICGYASYESTMMEKDALRGLLEFPLHSYLSEYELVSARVSLGYGDGPGDPLYGQFILYGYPGDGEIAIADAYRTETPIGDPWNMGGFHHHDVKDYLLNYLMYEKVAGFVLRGKNSQACVPNSAEADVFHRPTLTLHLRTK